MSEQARSLARTQSRGYSGSHDKRRRPRRPRPGSPRHRRERSDRSSQPPGVRTMSTGTVMTLVADCCNLLDDHSTAGQLHPEGHQVRRKRRASHRRLPQKRSRPGGRQIHREGPSRSLLGALEPDLHRPVSCDSLRRRQRIQNDASNQRVRSHSKPKAGSGLDTGVREDEEPDQGSQAPQAPTQKRLTAPSRLRRGRR